MLDTQASVPVLLAAEFRAARIVVVVVVVVVVVFFFVVVTAITARASTRARSVLVVLVFSAPRQAEALRRQAHHEPQKQLLPCHRVARGQDALSFAAPSTATAAAAVATSLLVLVVLVPATEIARGLAAVLAVVSSEE